MDEGSEAIRLGEALMRLRHERGLSQAEAGARIGMTSQGWGLYEAGKRAGIFRPDTQRKLTGALDATPEDLLLVAQGDQLSPAPDPFELQSVAGVQTKGRSFETAVPKVSRQWRLDHDQMAPWAYAGVVLEYVPGKWPRPNQGCIIDLETGQRLIGIYERGLEQQVFVRDGAGQVRAIERGLIQQMAAVVARIETG